MAAGGDFKYTPSEQGMRQFLTSKMISDSMLSVAKDFASQANRVGESEYQARSRRVTGGFNATERSGAEVVDLRRERGERSPDAFPARVLVNLSKTYRMRGGR